MTEIQKKEILKSLEFSEAKFQNMRMKKALDQADGKIQEVIWSIQRLKKWVEHTEIKKPGEKKQKKEPEKEPLCVLCAKYVGKCSWREEGHAALSFCHNFIPEFRKR